MRHVSRRRLAKSFQSSRGASRRSVIQTAVQTLESRRLLTSAAWDLSVDALTQNWTNPAQITVDDDWSGVPSIQGFLGDRGTYTVPADISTILTDASATLDVIANQSAPNTLTNGGVAEFDGIPDPSVALNGSGTADTPYVVFYVNTTGKSAIPVKFNIRDLDSSADNAAQQVVVQYRVGSTGDWSNIPTASTGSGIAYYADVTTGGTATQVTPVDLVLPAAADNQALVQIRVMTANAVGNDEWIGIDDVVIGVPSAGPKFSLSTSSVSVEEGVTAQVTVVPQNVTSSTSVRIRTVDGTALAAGDYTAKDVTLTFTDNTPQVIDFLTTQDVTSEATESFTVELVQVTPGSQLAFPTSATVTITDNDQAVPTGLLLNEVMVNPADTDGPYEYAEFRGTANTSLNGVYFVVLAGDTTANGGSVLLSIPLSGNLGSNGLAILKATSAGFTPEDANTAVINNALLGTASNAFGNGANGFALVFSPTAITAGQDLAPDDFAPLSLPSGAVLLDYIGTLNGTGGGLAGFYGPTIGQFVDAYTRLPSDSTALSAGAWYAGDILDPDVINATPLNSDSKFYNPLGEFGTYGSFPAGAVVTPGAANYAASASPGSFVLLPANPTSVAEGGSSTLTVVRVGGVTGSASVTVSLAGTASGADYSLGGSATLNFAAGQTSAQITLNITDDAASEGAETVVATLSAPTGGAVVTGAGTIVNITASDPVQTSVLINEAKINPNGSDDSQEFVELIGTPNAPLVGYWLLGIEGDASAGDTAIQGKVNFFQSLSNFSLGANGLLVLKGVNAPAIANPQTAVANLPFWDTAGGVLQNGSQSFILIFSENLADAYASSGANQFDFDANNDGTLDPGTVAGRISATAGGTATLLAPQNVLLVDGFGIGDNGAGDIVYTANLTQAGYTSTAVSRIVGNTTPLSASSWFGGTITGTLPSDNVYSATNIFNSPGGAPVLTPGNTNYVNAGDTTPPTVVGTPVRNYVAGLNVQITFSEDVSASLAAGDFTLTNTTTSAVIPAANINVAYNAGTNVATLTFPGIAGLTAGRLPNGNYTLAFGGTANAIEDAAGNDLAANTFPFRFVNGDANDNGSTNFDDLLILAANYNQSTGVRADLGDFDYSGNVNFDDLLILAANYNVTITGSLGGDALYAPPAPVGAGDTGGDEEDGGSDDVLA